MPTLAELGRWPDIGDVPPQTLRRLAQAPDMDQPVASGAILPLTRYADGSTRLDGNAGLLGMMRRAAALPADVYAGRVDPNSDDAISTAADLAGLMGSGTLANLARRVPKTADFLASNNPRMYDPPDVDLRPFEADYPGGSVGHNSGRLQFDIEGRPLTARYVVGRTEVGGGDVALPHQSLDEIATATVGEPAAVVPQAVLGRDVGRARFRKLTGEPTGIDLSASLTPEQFPRVYSHEVGHVFDKLAGEIPTKGLTEELRLNYHRLNDGSWRRTQDKVRSGLRTKPEDRGYAGNLADRELIAEAMRAYMQNPNYLKSVAPKTAARIREYVNANPRLKDTIQFNAGGVPLPSSQISDDDFRAYQRQGGA